MGISHDKNGEFTNINNHCSSVIDYIITSTDLFRESSYFEVRNMENIVNNSHFPLVCEIKTCVNINKGNRGAFTLQNYNTTDKNE